MNDFSKNIELSAMNSLLGGRANELSRKAERSDNSNLSDIERSKFAQVSRGFEAMFVNLLLKEMKSSLKENSEFSGPLQEYTDMMFADQIASQNTGIGIAEKVYEFLTGEKLPETRVIQSAKTAYSEHSPKVSEKKSPVVSVKPAVKEIQEPELPKGNFLDKVKARLDVYDDIITQASKKFNVPQELIKAVITAESAGHQFAKSKAGAKGLMQLMDGTALELGVTDSYDPAQNIFGGTLYLRRMLDKFDNNRELALAAYNAGPGNVKKYGGVPPFRETESYIKKVNNYIQQFLTEEKNKQGIMS